MKQYESKTSQDLKKSRVKAAVLTKAVCTWGGDRQRNEWNGTAAHKQTEHRKPQVDEKRESQNKT